jgi:hypothetical protein
MSLLAAPLSYGVSKLLVTPQNATHIAPIIVPEIPWPALGILFLRSWREQPHLTQWPLANPQNRSAPIME